MTSKLTKIVEGMSKETAAVSPKTHANNVTKVVTPMLDAIKEQMAALKKDYDWVHSFNPVQLERMINESGTPEDDLMDSVRSILQDNEKSTKLMRGFQKELEKLMEESIK